LLQLCQARARQQHVPSTFNFSVHACWLQSSSFPTRQVSMEVLRQQASPWPSYNSMSLQSSHLFCVLEFDFRVASQSNSSSRHPGRGKALLSHSNVQTVGCDDDHRLLIARHQALSNMPAEVQSQTCCQANHLSAP